MMNVLMERKTLKIITSIVLIYASLLLFGLPQLINFANNYPFLGQKVVSIVLFILAVMFVRGKII